MGNSAVAVLHYDMHDEIRAAKPRMAKAMLDMPGADEPQDFGFGSIVSWDHASGYQVVVVHGNTGWRIGIDDHPPPDDVMMACANALRSHGWRVDKPRTR